MEAPPCGLSPGNTTRGRYVVAVTRAARPSGGTDDPGVCAAAAKALELVFDGARVGLGSGRAASVFIAMLGARVREGLRISGVPTSQATAALTRDAGIPLIELGGGPLDITVDGADEVAPNIDLVKGWGGALVRERIVAASSNRQVILAGSEKLVHGLGERGCVPLEVIPLAEWLVRREVKALGLVPTLRMRRGHFVPRTETSSSIVRLSSRCVAGGQPARSSGRCLPSPGSWIQGYFSERRTRSSLAIPTAGWRCYPGREAREPPEEGSTSG